MTTLTSRMLRTRFTVVWFVLIGATLISWYFGADHGFESDAATSTLVLIVAFIKVRLVGLYFMELRTAPMVLRGLFEGYCIIVLGLILGFYYAT